ncbi:MFS transporter [Candidimonas nitroreducens]|uniref:MFS transporter n=1 Tax=Candidimonas nitroreducens TaxID=683354 RepID=UPI001302F22D|nr:MFS transporter [Candidimonas nitroreducens]
MTIILFIGVFVAYMDRGNVSVLVADPAFLNDIGIAGNPVKIGLIMTSYLVAFGLSSIIIPPFVSFLGPRKVMVLGIFVWAISLVVGATAFTFTSILVSRVLLGIGEGVSYPQSAVYIKNWIPPQERGRANTGWVVGQSISLAVTTPVIALFIALSGWRESYWALVVLAFVPMYLFWAHTSDKPRDHKKVNRQELEYIEAGLSVEVTSGNEPRLGYKERFFVFAKEPRYWLIVMWFMLMNFNSFGIQTWLPSYLKVIRGFSWGQMGFLASLPFVFLMFFKIGTGWITDKVSRNSVVRVLSVFSLLAAACIYGAVITQNNYVSAVLIALSYALCGMGNAVIFVLVQDIVPAKVVGSAVGFLTGSSLLFASLSPVIMGYAIKLGSYGAGLFVLAGASMMAAVITFILTLPRFQKCPENLGFGSV